MNLKELYLACCHLITQVPVSTPVMVIVKGLIFNLSPNIDNSFGDVVMLVADTKEIEEVLDGE
jgi:hypothetical protein